MAEEITLEFIDERGVRKAVRHRVNPRYIASTQSPKIAIRMGFESITLTREEFGKLLQTLNIAEASGASYPEDWKPFYDLEPSPGDTNYGAKR